MWLERETDTRMRRTANRPLPAGRLHHVEVVVVGTAMAVTGLNYLYHALPSPAAAIVAALSFVTYVLIYTPLKPVTVFNTHIGAIPGRLAAGHRLVCGDRDDRLGRGCVVPGAALLAIAALHGDRLDVPPGIRQGRAPDDPGDRPDRAARRAGR